MQGYSIDSIPLSVGGGSYEFKLGKRSGSMAGCVHEGQCRVVYIYIYTRNTIMKYERVSSTLHTSHIFNRHSGAIDNKTYFSYQRERNRKRREPHRDNQVPSVWKHRNRLHLTCQMCLYFLWDY